MTTMRENNADSLMDLLGRTDDDQIHVPKDIESAEDFIAWCRNVDRYPFDEQGIRSALADIAIDDNDCLASDLKTASRTFLKGSKRVDVLVWISEAFDAKSA